MAGLIHSKRAQVETQFNWIFVIVAGAVIMLFFVGIVMKQKTSSEIKISETVMTDLQSIFTGGSVSTGTSQLIEVPKVDIGFDCANYYLKGVTKPAENLIIFAPSLVQGRNIVTWTLDYNLPYKVTNFLYITTPDMRYIFVGADEQARLFYSSALPEDMNIEFVDDVENIKDKNNYKVRLIYFEEISYDPPFPTPIPTNLMNMGSDITALSILGDSLIFYKSDGNKFYNTGETYVVDLEKTQQLQPSKFGAIFTDDYELYNCMMRKALKRAYFVSKVYAERNENINKFFEDTNSYCRNFKYDGFDGDGGFVGNIEKAYEDFPNTQAQVLPGQAADIIDKNKRLLQKSCPLIY